jgi:hypothetical protein
MINISSSVNISFMFPADWETAFAYYSDIPRLVEHLRHIDLVPSADETADNEFRLCYHTVELGRYHIHVFCDIRVELDKRQQTIRLLPIKNFPPVKTEVSLNSTTTRGYYSSEGRFLPTGEQTRIEYILKLEAKPPRPKGMRFVPGRIVDTVAQNITTNRMKEIAEGFIENSVQSFPQWLAERG